MSSSSNGTSSPCKSKVKDGVVGSIPTRCNLPIKKQLPKLNGRMSTTNSYTITENERRTKIKSEVKSVKQDIVWRTQTIPSGSDPALVDRCIISSSWNVFDPGAAHTEQKTRKKLENTFIKNVQFSYISNGFSFFFHHLQGRRKGSSNNIVWLKMYLYQKRKG